VVTRRAWILFSAMCVLWGIPYLLIKVAVGDLSPALLVFFRTAGAAALLLPIAAARGQLAPLLPHWRPLLAFAALEISLPWLLLNDAERHLSSSFTGLLLASVPLVAAVASRVFGLEDRLDRTRALGLLVGLVGVSLLLGLDISGRWTAALEMLLVAVGYGTAPVILSRRLAGLPPLGVIAASLGVTAVAYLPWALGHWPAELPSSEALVSIAVLIGACTVAAFLVFFALIAEAGPNRALVVTFINPVVAVALGLLLLHEPFTVGMALGFPLVLAGCLLATRQSRDRVPAMAEP
jgi:drug/metabolite transporter (DMT)-like permease